MNIYYPSSTEKIIHKGKNGNIYKLDGIQKCEQLAEKLLQENLKVNRIEKDDVDIEKITNIINKIHNKKILESYKSGKPKELAESSGLMWQPELYNYVLECAQCCVDSVKDIINNETKKVLNILGGGHHAEIDKPLGFCTINTMSLCSWYASNHNYKNVILDLDTHYSNGCFDIGKDIANTKIYSLWNQKIDKWKYYENTEILNNKKINNIEEYFSTLSEYLKNIKIFNPDLFIYHLGLDVLETDRMGGIKGMTEQMIYKRERLVSEFLKETNIPYIIFMGGAYIDWKKGNEYGLQQREKLTQLQYKLLSTYYI